MSFKLVFSSRFMKLRIMECGDSASYLIITDEVSVTTYVDGDTYNFKQVWICNSPDSYSSKSRGTRRISPCILSSATYIICCMLWQYMSNLSTPLSHGVTLVRLQCKYQCQIATLRGLRFIIECHSKYTTCYIGINLGLHAMHVYVLETIDHLSGEPVRCASPMGRTDSLNPGKSSDLSLMVRCIHGQYVKLRKL